MTTNLLQESTFHERLAIPFLANLFSDGRIKDTPDDMTPANAHAIAEALERALPHIADIALELDEICIPFGVFAGSRKQKLRDFIAKCRECAALNDDWASPIPSQPVAKFHG